jgi:hypothetical protein
MTSTEYLVIVATATTTTTTRTNMRTKKKMTRMTTECSLLLVNQHERNMPPPSESFDNGDINPGPTHFYCLDYDACILQPPAHSAATVADDGLMAQEDDREFLPEAKVRAVSEEVNAAAPSTAG